MLNVNLKDWVVHSRAPTKGADQVLTYLSRYVHRVAFSESRILEVTDQQVYFNYKNYRKEDTENPPPVQQQWLKGMEFLRRFVMHVLPTGFQRIRYYGIWASAARMKLFKAQKLLNGPANIQTVVWSVRHFLQHILGFDPDICPGCGQRSEFVTYRIAPCRESLLPAQTENSRAPPMNTVSMNSLNT